MAFYKHITITIDTNDIFWVYNTDKATLIWLVTEIQKHMPSCQYYATDEVSGFINAAKIYKLKSKESAIYSLALNRLLEDGWKPYSAPIIFQHHLRKLIPK